ncbi:MAG TPA: NO-inducible flavohemoprotein [Bacillota bacterium]|nr:NO-inducible flavohemoprotein [Bacillota bacterium]
MPLSTETMNIIKSTAPVLEEHGATITTVFYKTMFENHPELLNIFNEANQKQGKQQVALANMVYAAAKNIDQLEVVLDEVKLVAHKHRGLDVRPEHYPIVGKYLLIAIKEVLGDAATDEIMQAWEEAYGVIAQVFIDIETEMYKEAAAQEGGWDGFKDFEVVDKVKESDVITSFYLEAKDGNTLPAYKAGQYLTIRVTIPGVAYKQIRHYTLSAVSNEKQYRISVKKEADREPYGVVSTYLHDQLQVGDTIEASAPAGTFTLEKGDHPVALISGGVGITPMLSMLESLAQEESPREISFLHAAQNEGVHAFHLNVEEWTKHLPNARYIYGYDRAENSEGNHHFTGYVTKEVIEEILKPDTTYYVVGPVPFMKHIARLLGELGVQKEHVRYELFGPAQEVTKHMKVMS